MIWMFFLLALLIPGVAEAACTGSSPTWTATPDQSSVQTCVTSATGGDTINVSAGDATWASPVVIASKRLTLTGAGMDVTNITDNATCTSCPGNGGLQITGTSTTNFVNVSGFTFIKQANHASGGVINIGGAFNEPNTFRIHHSRIITNSAGLGGMIFVGVWGLIDHVIFDITATSGSIHAVEAHGGGFNNGSNLPWALPSSIGTNRALFAEDNDFNEGSGDAIVGAETVFDGVEGARIVLRYNRFLNCAPGTHGTDSGFSRGTISMEMYNNTFTNNSAAEDLRALTIRGGTAIIHDNIYNGSRLTWGGYTAQYFRSNAADHPSLTWQVCNGTNWEVSGLTQPNLHTLSTTGNFRYDNSTNSVLGAEGDLSTYGKYFDNGGAAESGSLGYPCRDQPGIDSPQVLSPIYQWNNIGQGGVTPPYTGVFDSPETSVLVQENRDYFNYTASFNGTVGVGRGLRAARPATCTIGVAYNSTDGTGVDGALDKCTATNTWTNNYYIAYTYPHPLVGTVASSPSRRFIPHLNLRHALYDPSLFEWQPDGHIYLVSQ